MVCASRPEHGLGPSFHLLYSPGSATKSTTRANYRLVQLRSLLSARKDPHESIQRERDEREPEKIGEHYDTTNTEDPLKQRLRIVGRKVGRWIDKPPPSSIGTDDEYYSNGRDYEVRDVHHDLLLRRPKHTARTHRLRPRPSLLGKRIHVDTPDGGLGR